MIGMSAPDATIEYVVEPAAAKDGRTVDVTTSSPREVYADRPPIEPTSSPWPLS